MVCFSETFTYGDTVYLDLPGFTHHMCNRAAGQHGGIQVSLRNASPTVGLGSGVHVRCHPQTGVIWVRAPLLKAVFAVCYFAPASSVLYTRGALEADPLQYLFQGLSQAKSEGLQCVVVGDLNIRLGRLSSDVPIEQPSNYVPTVLADALPDLGKYTGIPHTRQSCDTSVPSRDLANQLMAGLCATELVLLNGRAPGDEGGALTYHQPLGRGIGRQGASVVDLACISAEFYHCVQHFVVQTLSPDRSPDHCTVELLLHLPTSGPQSGTRRAPVFRPSGKAVSDTYRTGLVNADERFAKLRADLQAGQVTLAEGVATITTILKECCTLANQAQSSAPQPSAKAGAPWFDDECQACCTQFRQAWKAFTELKAQLGAKVPAGHPVYVAALEARREYAKLKRRKKRAHARHQQYEHLETYFSDHQRDFWRAFNATKHAPCPIADVCEWTDYFKGLYGAQPPELQLIADQEAIKSRLHAEYSKPASDMDGLNEVLTYDTVASAMRRLPRFKAADAAGLTCELFRAAVHDDYSTQDAAEGGPRSIPGGTSTNLVECLVHILQHLPGCEDYPLQVATGKLVPVPKKACVPTDKSTYRGICVSSIFGKLHDSILTASGEEVVENLGLRAPTQFGFRRYHGTIDALFVSNHLINRCRHHKQVLYTCYVDFVQAFDMARRLDGMVQRAAQLGIHGHFLEALKSSMSNAYLAVSVNGQLGERFATYRGTKQGSELSPLLFGLFIEQLHELIAMQLPGAGPCIDGMHVPDIIYADDVKLLAVNDPAALQQLLDVLHLFCCLFDMKVNLKPHKTCIVIFRAPGAKVPSGLRWYIDGKEVHISDQYIDLGAMHHATCGIKLTRDALAASGSKAMHALLTRCRAHHIAQPDFKLRLFDIQVEPVLSYGCQVWGPEVVCQKLHDPLGLPSEKVHLSFLRIMSGVGPSTDRHMLLREFGRYPIMWHWLVLAVRYWARAVKLPSTSLVRKTLNEDIQLMLNGCTRCWTFHVLKALTTIGLLEERMWLPAANSPQPTVESILALELREADVRAQLIGRFDQVWQLNTRTAHPRRGSCPSDAIIHSSYETWCRKRDAKPPSYLKSRVLSFRMFQCLAKARLGRLPLAIHTGRFGRQKVPRLERVCVVCQALGYKDDDTWGTPVEDLQHFVLDCRALDPTRDRFPEFFQPVSLPASDKDTHMQFVLNHHHHVQLFRCINALLKRRERCLQLVQEGKLSDIMPAGYLPEDHNMRRIMAADAEVEEEAAGGQDIEADPHLLDIDDSSDWDELVEVVDDA